MSVVHIVGGGPTGIALAWNLRRKGSDVHLWEKRDLVGGSWWTPDFTASGDSHAPRLLFPNAQPNFRRLLNEMGLRWDQYFEADKDALMSSLREVWTTFTLRDYLVVVGAILTIDKTVTLESALGNGRLSKGAEDTLRATSLIVDGVSWRHMTLWELADTLNRVIFSEIHTQRVVGRHMCQDMHYALEDAGVHLHMGETMRVIEYGPGPVRLFFESNRSVELVSRRDRVILALDPWAASKYVGTNWGHSAPERLREMSYGSSSFLAVFDRRFAIPSPHKCLKMTGMKAIASWQPGNDPILLLTVLGKNSMTINHIIHALNLPSPRGWKECEQTADMSSAAWQGENAIPTEGAHPQVSLVGMMSPRITPYASVEAATEVALRWCGGDIREPLKATTLAFALTAISFLLVLYNAEARFKVLAV